MGRHPTSLSYRNKAASQGFSDSSQDERGASDDTGDGDAHPDHAAKVRSQAGLDCSVAGVRGLQERIRVARAVGAIGGRVAACSGVVVRRC